MAATRQELEEYSQQMREHPTKAERRMGNTLEAAGIVFVSQHIVGPYIVDFLLPEKMIIIELDGGRHKETVQYDARRDDYLRMLGFTVFRLWNNASMRWNLDEIRRVHPAPSWAYRAAIDKADHFTPRGVPINTAVQHFNPPKKAHHIENVEVKTKTSVRLAKTKQTSAEQKKQRNHARQVRAVCFLRKALEGNQCEQDLVAWLREISWPHLQSRAQEMAKMLAEKLLRGR